MEDIRMAQRSKRDHLQSIHNRYQQATRAEKQAILDEFMKVCGYHCKYAIGLLNRSLAPVLWPRRVPRRRSTYREEVIQMLAQIWEASGYLCVPRA
jgi:hypothetical protein